MEIRIRNTGAVMFEGEFRALHPDTSFPQVITEQMLNDFGADAVLEGPQAQPTRYQVAYRDGVEQIDGQWFTKYSVSDMDAEGIAAVDAQLKEANRQQAKQGLVDTDWCENASVRNTAVTPHLLNAADFDAYRLELRRIVINPPVDVQEWPTQPQGSWSE